MCLEHQQSAHKLGPSLEGYVRRKLNEPWEHRSSDGSAAEVSAFYDILEHPRWLEIYGCEVRKEAGYVTLAFELKPELLLTVMDPVSLEDLGFLLFMPLEAYQELSDRDAMTRSGEPAAKVAGAKVAVAIAESALASVGLDVSRLTLNVQESDTLWLVRYGTAEDQSEAVFKALGYSRIVVVVSKRNGEYRIFRSAYPLSL
jgi:hypothetical protein